MMGGEIIIPFVDLIISRLQRFHDKWNFTQGVALGYYISRRWR
jgi:hypothetical protein